MDRFLMHVRISYPDDKAEGDIIRLVRGETAGSHPEPPMPIGQDTVIEARSRISAIHSAPAIDSYIVDLIFATRYPDRYPGDLKEWIEVGASPRGGLALDKCARVHAWLQGSDFVTPENVRAVAHNCLRHRIIMSYEASADGITTDDAVDAILKVVAVP